MCLNNSSIDRLTYVWLSYVSTVSRIYTSLPHANRTQQMLQLTLSDIWSHYTVTVFICMVECWLHTCQAARTTLQTLVHITVRSTITLWCRHGYIWSYCQLLNHATTQRTNIMYTHMSKHVNLQSLKLELKQHSYIISPIQSNTLIIKHLMLLCLQIEMTMVCVLLHTMLSYTWHEL